jgi:hypothetical protein
MKISQITVFTPASLLESEELASNEYYVWDVTCTDGSLIPLKIRSLVTADKDINILCRLEGKLPKDVQKNMEVHQDVPKYRDAGGMDSHERGEYHRQQNRQYDDLKRQGTNYESVDPVLNGVYEDWQTARIDELSPETLSKYRDATAKPRATDRLGKVVKHTRGHNHAIDKIARATGDNTPNKDYARTMENNAGAHSITELSTNMLGKYKHASGKAASEADSKGNTNIANKRFSGIINATKKQFKNDAEPKSYEERLAEFVDLDEKRKEEKVQPGATKDGKYKEWNYRYQLAPRAGQTQYEGMAVHAKSAKMQPIKVTGTSSEDVVKQLQAEIDNAKGSSQITANKVTIDFNTKIASEIIGHGGEIFADIIDHQGQPMLLLSAEQQGGMTKAVDRTPIAQRGDGKLGQQAFAMNGKRAASAGLTHARYNLGQPVDYMGGVQAYPLEFASEVHPGESIRLGGPGLTVAYPR